MIGASPYASTLLGRLRPPCARTTTVRYGFSKEGRTNPGYTLRLPALDEPVVAAGDGIVKRIVQVTPDWQFTAGAFSVTRVFDVWIDHSLGVETRISGLRSVAVPVGRAVQRGDRIGQAAGQEFFFSIYYNNGVCNPSAISRHFQIQDERYLPGQAHTLRFAPDRIVRDVAEGVVTALSNGLRYFANLLNPAAYLISVDFNGSGAKTGFAATGVSDVDYWNVYTPVDFTTTIDLTCGYGFVYSSTPLLWLNDWRGAPTAARLEKLVEPPTPFFGSAASWDVMLATWIGGYAGVIPVETFFVVKGLPAGNYQIFLYSNQGATDFSVSVNAGPITTQSNSPTVVPEFLLGENYLRFDIVVPFGGVASIKSFGYLSGMQVLKV